MNLPKNFITLIDDINFSLIAYRVQIAKIENTESCHFLIFSKVGRAGNSLSHLPFSKLNREMTLSYIHELCQHDMLKEKSVYHQFIDEQNSKSIGKSPDSRQAF